MPGQIVKYFYNGEQADNNDNVNPGGANHL